MEDSAWRHGPSHFLWCCSLIETWRSPSWDGAVWEKKTPWAKIRRVGPKNHWQQLIVNKQSLLYSKQPTTTTSRHCFAAQCGFDCFSGPTGIKHRCFADFCCLFMQETTVYETKEYKRYQMIPWSHEHPVGAWSEVWASGCQTCRATQSLLVMLAIKPPWFAIRSCHKFCSLAREWNIC